MHFRFLEKCLQNGFTVCSLKLSQVMERRNQHLASPRRNSQALPNSLCLVPSLASNIVLSEHPVRLGHVSSGSKAGHLISVFAVAQFHSCCLSRVAEDHSEDN